MIGANHAPTDDHGRTPPIDGLAISIHHRSTEAHVLVGGWVDMANVEIFRAALFAAVRAEASAVIVNINSVDFLDARALGALVAARNMAIATERRLTVIEASPFAYLIFSITGLTEPFSVQRRNDRVYGSI